MEAKLVKLGARRIETTQGVRVIQPVEHSPNFWIFTVYIEGKPYPLPQFCEGDIYAARTSLQSICDEMARA